MNSPISPVSTVTRSAETSERPELGVGIDKAWINAQAFAFDHAHALRRDQFRPDIRDLAVLNQHRDALHSSGR